MFVFGHLGIGKKIASPFSKKLATPWLLLGTLLPDLLDKPLYYILCLATGKTGASLGLISGSRTLGHVGLLPVLLLALGLAWKNRLCIAIAVGMVTHLLLDGVSDWVLVPSGVQSSIFLAVVFPFQGLQFGVMPFKSMHEHADATLNIFTLTCEFIGVLLLGWEFRQKFLRLNLFSKRIY